MPASSSKKDLPPATATPAERRRNWCDASRLDAMPAVLTTVKKKRSKGWKQRRAERRVAEAAARPAADDGKLARQGQGAPQPEVAPTTDAVPDGHAGRPQAAAATPAGADPIAGFGALRATGLTAEQIYRARHEWVSLARIAQYPVNRHPPTWMLVGGRGAGKTRVGAEWVNSLVRGYATFAAGVRHMLIALVGETLGDVREVMIDGPSGIMTMSRGNRPRFEVGRRRLLWDNGAVAQIFSSEDPDSLRGPQFEAAWCDELAKWKHAEACFDMLQFGLRLGDKPRQLITTTLRPTPLIKRLMQDPDLLLRRMKTGENAAHLAQGFLDAMERRYAGTRLGRQELDGELIEDREDALWTRPQLEAAFVAAPPELGRIVVAIDPPASSNRASDACGIVAAGIGADGTITVLADATLRGAKPQAWAAVAVRLFHRLQADCIVAEVNQGGDMVTSVIRGVDADVPVRAVRARRGKWTRAEPVAMLYDQGRVRHAGRFAELEDEMCDFGPNGLSDGRSPDRVDALVWAVSELVADKGGEPRIRGLD